MKLDRILRTLSLWDRLFPSRQRGLRHEVRFWQRWFRRKGGIWHEDYLRRLDPNRFIDDHVCMYIDPVAAEVVRILDVGAGPLTILGPKHPSKRLEITATDELAEEYDRLIKRFAVSPPIRTVYAPAEQLTDFFPQDSFDLAYARNSLDHSADPLRAIREMVAVVRPERYVLLEHFENEAEAENYIGLHQWNFLIVNGDLTIRNRGESFSVRDCLGDAATISARQDGRIVFAEILKRPRDAHSVDQ